MYFSKKAKTRFFNNYGPWALVTGASSGIGLGLAERLAEAGLNLALNARNREELEKISSSLQTRYGIQTLVLAADLSNATQVQQVLDATKDLDVGLLVACAGYGTSGLFENADIVSEVDMLRVNCEAVLRMAHHFSQIFQGRKNSGMILMSSLVAFQGVPYAAHYAATKAYIQSLAEAIAIELWRHGTAVLAAAPGPVESRFGERANMKMSLSLKAADLALPILKALGRKSTVLPGFLSFFLVNLLRTVPRWAKVRIMKIVMGGMTAHQRIPT